MDNGNEVTQGILDKALAAIQGLANPAKPAVTRQDTASRLKTETPSNLGQKIELPTPDQTPSPLGQAIKMGAQGAKDMVTSVAGKMSNEGPMTIPQQYNLPAGTGAITPRDQDLLNSKIAKEHQANVPEPAVAPKPLLRQEKPKATPAPMEPAKANPVIDIPAAETKTPYVPEVAPGPLTKGPEAPTTSAPAQRGIGDKIKDILPMLAMAFADANIGKSMTGRQTNLERQFEMQKLGSQQQQEQTLQERNIALETARFRIQTETQHKIAQLQSDTEKAINATNIEQEKFAIQQQAKREMANIIQEGENQIRNIETTAKAGFEKAGAGSVINQPTGVVLQPKYKG